MPFHLSSSISETFMGGGGNVQAEINTFLAASVEVCYRYAVPVPPEEPPVSPPSEPPRTTLATPPAPIPTQLPLTGRATAPLAVAGVALFGVGVVLSRYFRVPRARFDM
jgi:hypothetical protein